MSPQVVTMAQPRSRTGRHRASWVSAAICLVVAVSGCAGSGASPSPSAAEDKEKPARDVSWSQPVELGSGLFPAIAVGPSSTTVIWNGDATINGRIQLRDRDKGEPWQPTRQLAIGAEHAVASNSSDLTVVAWAQPSPGGSAVMVTQRGPSGSWSEPRELRRVPAQRRVPGFGLHVAVGETGAAAVWWEETIEAEDPPDWNWSYATYAAPSGSWESVHQLVDRQHTIPGTAGSIDDEGGLDVVYATGSGIWMDRRDVTDGWVGPERVAAERDAEPILMETPDGDTTVVAWPTDDGIAARRRTEGQWEAITQWKARTADWTFDADMDTAGNVTFAWFSPNYRIQVREWPHGHGLEPERILLSGGADAYRDALKLAAGPSGDVVLGFVNWDGVTGSLRTLSRSRKGAWGPVQLVGRQISDPWFELVVRPSGVTEAVWEQARRPDDGRMTIRHSSLPASG